MKLSKKEIVSYTVLLTAGIGLVTKGSDMIEKGNYKSGVILTALGIVLIGLFIDLSYRKK